MDIRRTQNGWLEYYIYGYSVSLPAGTGTVFTPGNILVESEADFEAHKIVYQASNGNILIRLRDGGTGNYFVKDATDITLLGSNFIGTPFVLPGKLKFTAGSMYTVEAADASGVAQTLRLYFHGAKRRPGIAPWDARRWASITEAYTFTTQRQALGASSTQSYMIQIDKYAHFKLIKITGKVLGQCLITIKQSGAPSYDWQNTAVHSSCLLGNGQFPNILYAPRWIPKLSVISIDVQDLSGVANEVEIVLWGQKFYPLRGQED